LPGRKKAGERSLFFSNFQFMQTNQVMPHVIEFELLKGRDNFLAIMPFMKNTKCEHKHWIVWI